MVSSVSPGIHSETTPLIGLQAPTSEGVLPPVVQVQSHPQEFRVFEQDRVSFSTTPAVVPAKPHGRFSKTLALLEGGVLGTLWTSVFKHGGLWKLGGAALGGTLGYTHWRWKASHANPWQEGEKEAWHSPKRLLGPLLYSIPGVTIGVASLNTIERNPRSALSHFHQVENLAMTPHLWKRAAEALSPGFSWQHPVQSLQGLGTRLVAFLERPAVQRQTLGFAGKYHASQATAKTLLKPLALIRANGLLKAPLAYCVEVFHGMPLTRMWWMRQPAGQVPNMLAENNVWKAIPAVIGDIGVQAAAIWGIMTLARPGFQKLQAHFDKHETL